MNFASKFVAALVILCCGRAMAANYSVSGNFSPTSNPTGVWAYGTLTELGGTFVRYTNPISYTDGGTVNFWETSAGGAPADWNNASGTTFNNSRQIFLSGWAGFAPAVCGSTGCALGDFRFTAPTSGLYDLSLNFQSADLSGNLNTIVYVYIKGSTVFKANVVGVPSGSLHAFNGTYNLTAGEIVDIAVASNNNGTYDDTAVQGTISSTVPEIGSVQPNSLDAGSAAFTLTVNGSQFVSGDTVNWNGVPLTTTFVSASKLTAKVPAADVAAAGSAAVTVVDAAGGNAASNPALFAIPLTSLAITSQTSKAIPGGYSVTFTLGNTGVEEAKEISLTAAYLSTSATSTLLPVDITSLAPNGSKTVSLSFPSSAGKAGEQEYLSIYGYYAGGGIALSSVETLP